LLSIPHKNSVACALSTVPKLATLDVHERPLRTFSKCKNTCVLGAHHENSNGDCLVGWYQRQK